MKCSKFSAIEQHQKNFMLSLNDFTESIQIIGYECSANALNVYFELFGKRDLKDRVVTFKW